LALLLMSANTLSFIDRTVMALLVDPIRSDLHISDTQISLLQGLAFALFYAAFGLPLGQAADRGNRPILMSAGVGIWSVMTAGCGLAANFWGLFLARMGVAVGEAALAPAAVSILSDRFPQRLVARALAVFQSGIFIGSALALICGGALLGWLKSSNGLIFPGIGRLADWRVVFIAVGAPGLVLVLALLAVREPRRRVDPDTAARLRPTISQALRWIWRRRRLYGAHFTGFTLITILAYGALAWTPTVMIRRFGVPPGAAGLDLGLILLAAGPVGVFSSGWLIDRLLVKGLVEGPILAALAGVVLFAFALPAYALAPGVGAAMGAATLLAFAQSYPYGIASASLALVTPPELRGQVTALYLLISNLLGLSLGPLLVALMTEHVFHNDQCVGVSLAILPCLTAPFAIAALWSCRKPYAEALQAIETGRFG